MERNPIQTESGEFIAAGIWKSRENSSIGSSWIWGLFVLLSSVFLQVGFMQIQILHLDASRNFIEQQQQQKCSNSGNRSLRTEPHWYVLGHEPISEPITVVGAGWWPARPGPWLTPRVWGSVWAPLNTMGKSGRSASLRKDIRCCHQKRGGYCDDRTEGRVDGFLWDRTSKVLEVVGMETPGLLPWARAVALRIEEMERVER